MNCILLVQDRFVVVICYEQRDVTQKLSITKRAGYCELDRQIVKRNDSQIKPFFKRLCVTPRTNILADEVFSRMNGITSISLSSRKSALVNKSLINIFI
jgi:hypothetical protein